MKKLLPLLALSALSLQIYSAQNDSDKHEKVHETNIETLVETYKHPEAKKVGERMPQPEGGKVISSVPIPSLNIKKNELIGFVILYDLDGDEDAEYGFMKRYCNSRLEVETYVAIDVSNRKIYIDSSGDKNIDYVLEINSIEKDFEYIIPICKKEKPLMPSKKNIKA